MSSTTMLQLMQQAYTEMGLSVPSTVAGNSTADVVQGLGLLNAVGYEIQRQWQWQALSKVYIFDTPYLSTTGTTTSGSAVVTAIPTTAALSTNFQVTGTGIANASYISSVDSATQVTLTLEATASGTAVALTFSQTKFTLPSDYDRQIDGTQWDKTQHWMMLGPVSAQKWELLTSGYISTGPRVNYRIFGDKFQIWPPQGTEHQLGFEYLSKAWAATTAGVAKNAFTIDTDTCIFPDRLMVLGLKKKYFQVKGFNPVFDNDYAMELDNAKSNDAGSAMLSMAPRPAGVLLNMNNIPDSGYGT